MMKTLLIVIFLITSIGGVIPASAMLVAGDDGIAITGDLRAVRSTWGHNYMSINAPYTTFQSNAEIDLLLFGETGEMLAKAPLLRGTTVWAAHFRSPTNRFTHFGDKPTTLINSSFDTIFATDLHFEVRFAATDLTIPLVLPPISAFVGYQDFEFLAWYRGEGPIVVVENLSFIPEPSGAMLMTLAFCYLLMRRSNLMST